MSNASPGYSCNDDIKCELGETFTVTTQHKQDHKSSLSPPVKYFY